MKYNYSTVIPERSSLSKATRFFVTFLVCFGLLSPIVLPAISFAGVNVYLVTLISPMLFLLVIFFWCRAPFFHISSMAPLALGVMVCLSSIFSWVLGVASVNSRDIIEAIKYVQFLPYLLTVVFLSYDSLRAFHWLVVVASFNVLVVGYVQVFQVPLVASFVSYFYLGADSSHIDAVLTGYRVTLTGSDPNVGGVIACFFFIYYFAMFFSYKKYRHALFSVAFFYLCFETQSRTALLALVFATCFYYLFIYRGRIVVKIFALIWILSFIVFLVFYLDLHYIYIGIQTALEGNNNSLNVRLESIDVAIARFLEYPVLGMGPAKAVFETTIDSEYALIIQRYGILGILVFGFYLLYLFRLALRNSKSHWGVALLVFALMSLLVMVTNNIFSGYQLMSFVVILNMACVLNERYDSSSKKESIFESGTSDLRPYSLRHSNLSQGVHIPH